MSTLQNSEFKDWGMKKYFHLIKYSSKGIEKERYALVMTKGNEKKTNYSMTRVNADYRRGVHEELQISIGKS